MTNNKDIERDIINESVIETGDNHLIAAMLRFFF